MIYSAWYFCNITKLSIVETKGVLSAVQALSCSETSFEERNKVIDMLGEYDSLIQSYMVPYLTACLMTSDNRKWINQLPDSLSKQDYIQKVKDLLMNLSSKKNRHSLINLIQNLEHEKYESVVKCVVSYLGDAQTSLEENLNYLQGDRFFQEVFLLSVLRCVSYENVNMVSDLVRGDKQIELVQLALSGYFGQLCWNIATEILLQCGVSTYEVIRLLPDNWQERPDMVELMVPFLFPDDAEDSMQEIMKETYKLMQFRKYWIRQKKNQNGCWMNVNATEEERARLCIVLWQNVLWNLAMNRDFDHCVEFLKDMWETPRFNEGKISSKLRLNQYQCYMLPENTNVYRDEHVYRYACSPWQERTESLWNKGRGSKAGVEHTAKELFHEFRGFARNDNGEKVFMAVSLIERIFIKQNKNIDDFFIRLLLHFGDLFSCYGARSTFQQVTSPPIDNIRVTAWELPVRALGYWARDIVKNIGMGIVNTFVPEKIINHLYKRSPVVGKHEAYKNKQLEYLYGSCAFLTSAYWAYESLSTTSISQSGVTNMWIKNGRESYAAKLCNWIFLHLYRQAVNDRSAIQLDVQAFDSRYSVNKKNRLSEWLNNIISGKSSKVRFNQLILCRELTYSEWYGVGDITPQKFDKDAYLIAHTMRVHTLLESEYSALGHSWISEWKNAVSDISHKWEFSRMVRYIMVQMFTTNPGHKDNYAVLVDLLKIVIHMIQEFSTLDSIYYVYRLAESLIKWPDELGEETRKDLRGINAVELFHNMDNSTALPGSLHKWEDLFYYYLLEISDNSQIDSKRYAGNLLKKDWEAREVRRNHLRTELIEAAGWNQFTDRMWLVKEGKLLVVRDSFGIPEDCRTGVVAKASYNKSDNTFDYIIYSEGEIKKFKRNPNKLRKGDLIEIRNNDQARIESYNPVRWRPGEGERVSAIFEVTGDEITVHVMGNQFVARFEDSPELFRVWNGDFGELFSHGHKIKGKTVVQYAKYSEVKYGWVPFANRYPEFLVQKMFLPDNPERVCTLTFLGETGVGTELLFSVRAGENYILEARNWTEECWKRIENELIDNGDRKGIRLQVRLVNVSGFPRLELDKDEPYDYRNIRWREQFADEQPFQIWYEDGKWVTGTGVQEIREKVVVWVKSRKGPRDENSRYNVQVTVGGWQERNQRKGYLEAEEVKSRVLDFWAVTHDELKRLIQIKEGDVFKLKKIWLTQQTKGYYKAELDNKLTVYCAAESFSLLSDSSNKLFWQNRLCVVENIRENKNYSKENEHTLEPCNPVELQGKQGKYLGIVAEITPIINNKSEYAQNLELKVFVDIDGEKKVLNIPTSAFVPKPQHLGDRIEAECVEGGWIFHTLCRTINVRALWQVEDHRGQKDVRVFGAPLGLTNISRMGNCMATQDEEKPVLHLWDSEVDFQHVFTMQCGVQCGKGKVRHVERRYSDRRIFRWAYDTAVVELQSGENIFIGESKFGAFKETSKGWRVKAEIYRIYDSQSEIFYDLRRCFIPINTGLSQNNLSGEIDEERRIYYQEWLENENNYATGQINGQLHNADKIVLKELYVPSEISDQISDVKWINEIPLEVKQRPIILGRDYSTDNVRVKLKNRDGKYIASVNDAEAMLLDEKLLLHFDAYDGYTTKDTNFYFAGRDDQGRLLFEWGFGFYFAADVQDVTDIYGNMIGNELFFGDRIEAFTFKADLNGKYHWRVRASQEQIYHEVEGQVWEDAEKKIIQLLKVKINQKDGSAEIYEISVADRMIRISGKQSKGWGFKPIGNAKLKSEDMKTIVSQIGATQKKIDILACLDQQNHDKASNCLEFSYIPLDGSRDQLKILNNKILCLTAGQIKNADMQSGFSKIANDQKLEFFLPDELPENCENPHMVVSVMRRNFSLDESRLRVYSQLNPDAYYGNKMLVKLKDASIDQRGEWNGSVLETRFRSNASLISWLEVKKQCIVTLGTLECNKQKLKCAEIAPGIIFDITKFCENMHLVDGSLASLRLVDNEPLPEVVLPGDIQYIPDGGRPVELLIMDGVLKKYAQTVDMDEVTAKKTKMTLGGHFTIAGFPQIRLQNPELLDQMIRNELPRLGVIYKNLDGKLRVKAAETNVSAGYLAIAQESNVPVLNLISPVSCSVYTSWDQITFMDGKPEKIIEHVQRGVWHYHDRFTAVYKDEERKMNPRNLPDGKNYKEILVFTGKGKRLRYLSREFERFGMSAREIVENGLPVDSKWYPVAGVTDHSLWIEIFPGKILELLRTYLYTGIDKSSLSQLYVGAFAPGDEILLDEEKTMIGGHGKILLLGYKFGARSAFGKGRMFLPIQRIEEDSLCLGGGFWKMNYPKNPRIRLNCESGLVMLDQENKLSNVNLAEQVMLGDCVFLTLDERDRLCIAGESNIKVEFDHEFRWGEMAWLVRALQQDRRGVLRMFENYLPVIIRGKNEDSTKVWVIYKQQENPCTDENATLCCNCIGMLRYLEKKVVVLRSGGYLFYVEDEDFIEGVSKKEREEIVRILAAKRTEFLMSKIDGEWKSGLNIQDNPERMEIQMLYPIPKAKGFLCRNRKDLSLRWLPLEYTCRVWHVEIDKIWGVLSEERNRTARLMENGTLSLIHEQDCHRRFVLLDMRSSKYRAIPKAEVKQDSGYYYYLSELYPSGDLLMLKSENILDCGCSEPVRISILEKKETSIIVVPQGQMRQKINLSPWVVQAYRRAYRYQEDVGSLDCEAFQQYVPHRFDNYLAVMKQAREDVNSGMLDDDILKIPNRLEDQLVYLYELLKMADVTASINKTEIFLKIYDVLKAWLLHKGKFLACGFYNGEKVSKFKKLDLLPTIVAILLLNRINFESNTVGKELTVHLMCMLGYASGNSLHQEALLKLWLLKANQGGVWKRLNRLSLGGESTEDRFRGIESEPSEVFDGTLSEGQYSMLTEIAKGIAERHIEDNNAKVVAESLLYSVGTERDYTELYQSLRKQEYSCFILAPLGRILVSQEDKCRDISILLAQNIKTLENAMSILMHEKQPVELLTYIPVPITDEQREHAMDKCDIVIDLLYKKIENKRKRYLK